MAKNSKQSKALPIYILNGPNLNLLGHREPEVYGYTTLAEIEKMCADQAKGHGLSIVFRQSNREGEIGWGQYDWHGNILQQKRHKPALLA